MSFAQADIGPKYDIGLATRPNLDGSTAFLSCLDENGNLQNLSQVAYMFSAKQQDQEESTDLVRKEQLTRLSSPNQIDREFTLNPQATQGNWVGGELQRIFTDPAAYYQGRGLIWPLGGYQPSAPVIATVGSGGATQVYGYVVAGVYNGQPGYAVFGTLATNNTMWWISNQGITTVTQFAGAFPIYDATVILGSVYYLTNGNAIRVITTGADTLFLGAGLSSALAIVSGFVGSKAYLAVADYVNNNVKIIDATNSASVTTIPFTAVVPTAMAFSGGHLIMAATDGPQGSGSSVIIWDYDIVAGTIATVATLIGYASVYIAAVSGTILVAMGGAVTGLTGNPNVDCFLLQSGVLQYISTVPDLLVGTGTPTRYQMQGIHGVTSFESYAVFIVSNGPSGGTQAAIMAYDVQRGTWFTLADSLPAFGSGTPIIRKAVAVTVSPNKNSAGWAVVTGGGSTSFLSTELDYALPSGTSQVAPPGRVISSLIDFTSASVKLYRQIVVTHAPIVANGKMIVNAWFDTDDRDLGGQAPVTFTNTTVGSTTTVLLLNKLAKKLVYMVDWSNSTVTSDSPRPQSVAVQVSTGWVWKVELGISNLSRTNGQQVEAFENQGQSIDAKAAYNFIRQLWRQKGGQCIGTFPNGDQYNAVIQSVAFPTPKPGAVSLVADKKTHYEVLCRMTIAEDL